MAGRVAYFQFTISGAAMLVIASKSPTHGLRFRLESDCGRPDFSDELCTCRAEMTAPIAAEESDSLALRGRLAQP